MSKINPRKNILFTFAAVCLLAQPCLAKHLHTEAFYQEKECKRIQGKTEVLLPDNTRIDCLTEIYAIEFDFASKWAEAIGQSLHYARLSGKKAGIVLIVENEKEEKYYQRAVDNIYFYKLPITVWMVKSNKQ